MNHFNNYDFFNETYDAYDETDWDARIDIFDAMDRRRCNKLKNSLMSEFADLSYDDYGDWASEFGELY